jgi:uncharacterized repeat protein (TIGR01451 family)/uncharacterized delta-60 repeat protein
MLTRQLSKLTRAARCCAALAAAAALWGGMATECKAQYAPPNDNLANAQGIIGVSGSVSGTNLFATAQTNEPAPYPGSPAGASIWYAWTAPISTKFDFNTRGSTLTNGSGNLATALAVYRLTTGTNVTFANLTVVAQNEDDPSGGVDSRVDFSANLGTLYLIQVDGASIASGSNAEGYTSLNWSPSLVAGTFQFTTSLFPMGAFDDGFLVQPANQDTYTNFIDVLNGDDLSPSIHNAQGANNARITVTRTGGYTGRCEVELIVTNAFYTNFFITNYTGTNIFVTNLNASGTVVGYTNTFSTNTSVEEEIANNSIGFVTYFKSFLGFTNTLIIANNAIVSSTAGFLGITNLPPPPCVDETGEVTFTTNGSGTAAIITATQINSFCSTTTTKVVTPSAINGEDYLSTDSTNLTFDDFQMSQDIYLNLPGYFYDGTPPGPDAPEIYFANASVQLILADAVLDPKEDPDIIPPTISPTLGTSVMNVLNFGGLPEQPFATNPPTLGDYATLNIERATFRINKPTLPNTVQTNKIWVIRDPVYYASASTIEYTIDTLPGDFNSATLDWNHFPTVAGSDYANPSANGLPDFDFIQTYSGVHGTLNFPGDGGYGVEEIDVIVTNNGAQEFDSDFYVQLYQTVEDFMGDASAAPPTFLGNITSANVTINFSNPNPGVQPGGAWDRTFNPDNATNSTPPFNQLPGANEPVQAIAIQANGQAIIGGDFTSYDSTTNSSYVVRLTPSGFLDSTFYSGSGPNGSVDALAIDASGNVYIGGQFTSVNGVNAFHIARLTPTGALDPKFANGSGFNSTVWALAIDGSGNILAGGDFTNYNATNCNHIARLLPSGKLDPNFLPSSNTPKEGTDQDVRAVATDSNGNVILGGDFATVNGTNWNHIARLLTNGTLDASFNPGFGPDNSVYSLAIQANNYIIIGGAFANYNLVAAGSIARLAYNGALDTSFATGTGANGIVYSVLLQPNGTVLLGGQFTSFNTTRRIGIARLLSNGWLDTSFMDTAYNQFAGFINHYYNVNAINQNDSPAEYNSLNIVSAMGYDKTGNVTVGGSFTRVGGGLTRDQIHFQQNLTRLIGAPTPGPETGGNGNDPGNIGMTLNTYSVGDTANKLYVTLDRLNGSLGPASVSLGTNTFPPGPGSASDADFGLATAAAEFHDVYDLWEIAPSGSYGWRVSDGYFGFNYETQPPNASDGGASALGLVIHNDLKANENLDASLALLNLSSFGLLTLGGQTIPTGPALGQSSAALEIIDNNFPQGTFGFSATNYTVVNTAGSVTITVVRTNGSTGTVTVDYTTYNGFINGAGTNVATYPTYYTKTTNSLTFFGNQTSATFTVPIVDQSVLVPTTFFNVVLSNPSGSASLDTNVPPLVPSTAVVEIIDGNFQPGHLEFSSPTYNVLKGSLATVTVNRVGGALGELSVECATSNGTAVSPGNYTATTSTLMWQNQSVTPQTMTIQTIQDNVVEGAKTVDLSLFNPSIGGSTPGTLTNQEVLAYPSNAVLTINDIDSYGTLNFSVGNYQVLQNAGSALITVVRTGGTIGTVSVNVATFNGTNAQAPYLPAYAGTNYGAYSNQLTFTPGVSSLSFTIPIYYTPNETNPANRIVNLVLFNGSPSIASQFPKTAILTILDNQLVLSPAGSVDQTTQNGSGFNNDVQSLSLQPDGSLLAGGDFTFFDGLPFDYIGRLIPNGYFDSGFLFNLAGANSTVCQVLSQTPSTNQIDGSIMMVGEFTQVDQVPRAGVARLDLNGSLDTSFNPGAGADSTVYAITEQFLPAPQTNLPSVPFYVIGGNFANFDGAPSGGVARLTAAGALDPTFNIGAGITGTNAAVHAVALEPNNQILVAGDFTSFNNATHHHLVRLNVDGSVDTNFAAFDGVGSDINGSVRALQVQPDGDIIIGGLFTSVNGSNYNYIARLNNNGTLDTNFNIGVGCNNGVLALALDSQTRILVGGEFTKASGVTRNGITRLNPDGTVDPTINFGFGANGYVDSIVFETNGEIDVAGGFTTFNNIPENDFVRLYGGANAGDGSLEFSQQVYGVLESATNAVITIERLGGEGTTAQPTVSVEFSTSNTTNGVSGQNYVGVTTNIVFPYGETFETITVPIINSAAVAPNAVVNLNLTNAVNVAIGPQTTALLIITNVNTAVEFSADSYRQSANASIGYADIPIVRIGNPNSTFSVTVFTGTYAGTNGAATPYTNYTPVTNILTFTPGVMTVDWQVPITNAPTQFEDLAVALEMTGASNAIISSPSSATLIIASVNNAPGDLAFSQSAYSVSEGATNAAITIVRTNGTLNTVSAVLTTANGTATNGLNYTGVTNTVHFDSGITVQTVYIPVIQQTSAGQNVTVLLTLSDPVSATLGVPSEATLTIDNDLENFSFGAANYDVNENVGTVTITILRNGPTNSGASVFYTTYSPPNADDANGFAVPGVDYVPASGTLEFRPGVSLQTIPITIIQGNSVNGLETFEVELENPSSGAQIGSPGAATVVITSDVTGFAFSTNTYYVGENGSNVVITVNRINPDTGAVSVRYATSDNTALNGQDYVATSGTLSFQNGQSSMTFSVQILNPNSVEANKSFNVMLLQPSTNSFLVAPSNAVVIITNVNAGFSFGSPSFTVSECGGQAEIPVILSGVTTGGTSVNFSTEDISGKENVNYFPTNGTLYFTNGQTVQTFSVKVINNNIIGPDHTVQLNLSDPTNAQLLNPSTATLTIQECNGAYIVASGTAFVSGSILPGTGVIYSNDVVKILFGLRDIAGGNTTNLVATLMQTNGVTNVTSTGNYGILVQNGPTKSEAFTFTAIGTNGENITATLALQDGTRDLGTVAFGFTIGGATLSFTNSEPLIFAGVLPLPSRATNSFPPSFGYPSLINVSGIVGTVTEVTATLTNFGHTFPEDVNVLLEDPQSTNSILMSHCGASSNVQHVTLTFDQTAANFLPLTDAITTGTYKPTTNYSRQMGELPTVLNTGEGVPTAPQTPYPYVANLGVFVGAVPNGNWALWIDDDDTLDNGYLSNGWILHISIGTQVENDSDLEVTFTPSTTNATLSNSLTYYVTLTNFGPSAATNVVISNAIPSGMTYLSNSCDCGAVLSNGVLTFTYPSLAVGAGTAFGISMLPTELGYSTNTIGAFADEPDPNSNNIVTTSVLVSSPEADVGISLTATPDPVLAGANVTYVIVVTNNGPSIATGVSAVFTLPNGFYAVSISPSGSATNSSGTITWNVGTLGLDPVTSTATLTVVAQALLGGTGTATATVSSAIFDPTKVNNFASAKTEVEQPELTVSGVNATYTLTWPASFTNFVLEGAFNLPPVGTWVPINPPPPVISGQYSFSLPGTTGYHFFRLATQMP